MDQSVAKKCKECGKSEKWCLCAEIEPTNNALSVLILQHPQESREPLSTASIVHKGLSRSHLRIGLSFRNLGHALGLKKGEEASPGNWAVVYLGSGVKKKQERESKFEQLCVVNKNGVAKSDQLNERKKIKGVILLDGTWSQAKTLWWRNAWLLKLNRIILSPSGISKYNKIRKEPRKECLSTLESAALILSELGDKEAASRLTEYQEKLIAIRSEKK